MSIPKKETPALAGVTDSVISIRLYKRYTIYFKTGTAIYICEPNIIYGKNRRLLIITSRFILRKNTSKVNKCAKNRATSLIIFPSYFF